ncbi:MAG: signal recognition particle-docking protein FtsY [Cyanobacteriota bacterium]
MGFDWFQRRLTQPESAEAAAEEPSSAEDPSPAEEPSTPEAEASAEPAPADPADPAEPALADPAGSLASPPAAGASAESAPSPSGIDSDALAWARAAYARLKAEQQAALQTQPPTSPASGAVTEPEPASEQASSPQVEAAPEPEPQRSPERSLEPESTPSAPLAAAPLSLLERAAAERQQRQQELLAAEQEAAALAASTPPAVAMASSAPEVAAPPAAAAEADEVEPSLGAFDEAFTWSAEVLAAQGRRVDQVSLEEIDWLSRLRRGLEKTRRGFVSQLLEKLGDDPLTPEVLDDLESTLLRADVGVQATDQVIEALRARLNQEVVDASEGLRFLKEQLRELLEEPIQASGRELLAPERDRLNIWLLVGVNGVGKTTTLGKLANLAVRSGYSCLIAAADTFRAAAVEQVRIWGERSGVPVIANPSANADPAAVVYDSIGAAKANGTELVLVDTAGRLQTKHNLMEELSKVRRIVDKLAPEAVVESLLVLDASQGQNGLRQAMAFAKAAGLTGVVITKLDGSSRGGVALAVCREAGLPIRFIGAGEGLRDLRPFNSYEFVEALLAI